MPKTIHVPGPAHIKVGTTSTYSELEELGYTANGADIEFRGFHLDVPGDEHGGDQGPPIDVEYLGEIAVVRLDLTKFDPVVLEKVLARLRGGTAGTPAAPGSLLQQDSKYFRLLIDATNEVKNFPVAFIRGSATLAVGSKFQRPMLEFECHKAQAGSKIGILWDDDETGATVSTTTTAGG